MTHNSISIKIQENLIIACIWFAWTLNFWGVTVLVRYVMYWLRYPSLVYTLICCIFICCMIHVLLLWHIMHDISCWAWYLLRYTSFVGAAQPYYVLWTMGHRELQCPMRPAGPDDMDIVGPRLDDECGSKNMPRADQRLHTQAPLDWAWDSWLDPWYPSILHFACIISVCILVHSRIGRLSLTSLFSSWAPHSTGQVLGWTVRTTRAVARAFGFQWWSSGGFLWFIVFSFRILFSLWFY